MGRFGLATNFLRHLSENIETRHDRDTYITYAEDLGKKFFFFFDISVRASIRIHIILNKLD